MYLCVGAVIKDLVSREMEGGGEKMYADQLNLIIPLL